MMRTRIRELREDQDLKQREVAGYLSIAQTTYSDYEAGKLNIPLIILNKLADYYQTSTDYLLYRTDQMKPYPRPKR